MGGLHVSIWNSVLELAVLASGMYGVVWVFLPLSFLLGKYFLFLEEDGYYDFRAISRLLIIYNGFFNKMDCMEYTVFRRPSSQTLLWGELAVSIRGKSRGSSRP